MAAAVGRVPVGIGSPCLPVEPVAFTKGAPARLQPPGAWQPDVGGPMRAEGYPRHTSDATSRQHSELRGQVGEEASAEAIEAARSPSVVRCVI